MDQLISASLSHTHYWYEVDILKVPAVMMHYIVFVLAVFWCPYMAINVSVQYNGGLLPDIILLT